MVDDERRRYREGFGEVVRSRRAEAGLSQEVLAERLNVDRRQVARMEAGKQAVELDVLVSVASAFGVSVLDLFGPLFAEIAGISAGPLTEASLRAVYESEIAARYRSALRKPSVLALLEWAVSLSEPELDSVIMHARGLRLSHEVALHAEWRATAPTYAAFPAYRPRSQQEKAHDKASQARKR